MTSRRAFVARAAGLAAALPGFRPDAMARALSLRDATTAVSAAANRSLARCMVRPA